MSLAVRIAFASLSLTSLAAAVACGAPGESPASREQVGSTHEALLLQVCPPGTEPDCSYDLGPGGKVIRSCTCVDVPPPPPVTPKAIAVGDDDNGCLLLSTGAVECWSGTAQVADAGPYEPPHIAPPSYALTTIALPAAATSISAGGWGNNPGYSFACAVLSDHTVWCWGANYGGMLGNGTTQASPTPVQVQAQMNGVGGTTTPLLATKVVSQSAASCALTTQGGVACWGNNSLGQLGNAAIPTSLVNTSSFYSAVAVPAGPLPAAASSIAMGVQHACALLVDGRVFCWGDNVAVGTSATLGVGSSSVTVNVPAQVTGLPAASALSAGNDTTCAIAAGQLYCWGNIDLAAEPYSASPVVIGTAPASIASGEGWTCEIASGVPECWGGNQYQAWTYFPSPSAIFGTSTAATSIATGGFSACVITTGDQALCHAYGKTIVVY
jgi:hypothetical protein